MVDITAKSNTLRKAIAIADLQVSNAATIQAVQERKVPKGDVFEFSRAAGLLAIKKTSDVIPDCHPLPVEFASITFKVEELRIIILVEVHTIYKTGVEVEAMHGAAITALTIYDMLKPIDKGVTIGNIRLESKTGGKSGMSAADVAGLRAAVVVCSDSVTAGEKNDTAGAAIISRLETAGIKNPAYNIIPDDAQRIREVFHQHKDASVDLLIFTGGTGLSPRDITPDTIAPLLDREIPGIMEAARNYGQQRTPFAMLSRSVAGFSGKMLVLTLPGSLKGATETLDALFPQIFHVFQVAAGKRHD